MPQLVAALIRHGEYRQLPGTPSAHQPFPLTPEGEAQAQACGRALRATLAEQGWTLSLEIESSSLLRAWQTARGIAEELSASLPAAPVIVEHDDLAERCVGSAANLAITDIEAMLSEDPRYEPPPAGWKSDSHYRLPFPGAESLAESGGRVARVLEERMAALAAEVQQDTLKLFVGHGAAFRHAAWKLGVLGFDDIARLSMFHARPVFLGYDPADGWTHVCGDWKVRGRQEVVLD